LARDATTEPGPGNTIHNPGRRTTLESKINRTVLALVEGDLTELDVDAVVNAANSALQLGGGVAGAIRSKGGPTIQAECDRIGEIPVGTAAITGGGKLKARRVIHAVGPRIGEGDEERKLAGAVRSSLALADRHGLRSIAFPAISTGIFGYPIADAARVMLAETIRYLEAKTGLTRVVFCLFGQDALRTFERALKELRRA
jgi:O-acetyl-ADP-ribose deacetylase (regulator of RNase III)